MKGKERNVLAKAGLLMGLIVMAFASGCVIAPDHERGYREGGYREGGYREGYYDRDHHRWYHEHSWVECRDGDEHCH